MVQRIHLSKRRNLKRRLNITIKFKNTFKNIYKTNIFKLPLKKKKKHIKIHKFFREESHMKFTKNLVALNELIDIWISSSVVKKS